jgi:hypothetical protein
MNVAVIVRIAKFVALFGFFLPWVMFSCSGQPLGTMSGIDVAIGHFNATNPMNGQVQTQNIGLNLLVLAALAMTVIGLLVSFTAKDREGLQSVAIFAVIAAATAFFGMMWLKDSPRREMAEKSRSAQNSSFESQMGAASLAAITIKEETGYWITLAGLAGAAVTAFVAQSPNGIPALEGEPNIAQRRPEDDEVAYWDGVDKNDPLALREFLLRFPTGRFAELARMKRDLLEKGGQAASGPLPPAAGAVVAETPPANLVAERPPSGTSYRSEPSFDDSEAAVPEQPRPVALIGAAIVIVLLAIAGFVFSGDLRKSVFGGPAPVVADSKPTEVAPPAPPQEISDQGLAAPTAEELAAAAAAAHAAAGEAAAASDGYKEAAARLTSVVRTNSSGTGTDAVIEVAPCQFSIQNSSRLVVGDRHAFVVDYRFDIRELDLDSASLMGSSPEKIEIHCAQNIICFSQDFSDSRGQAERLNVGWFPTDSFDETLADLRSIQNICGG